MKKEQKEKICAYCGKVFVPVTRNNLTRYCSKECAKASLVRVDPDQNHPVFGNIKISKEFQNYLMTEILVLDFVDFKNIFELGKALYFKRKLCSESNC